MTLPSKMWKLFSAMMVVGSAFVSASAVVPASDRDFLSACNNVTGFYTRTTEQGTGSSDLWMYGQCRDNSGALKWSMVDLNPCYKFMGPATTGTLQPVTDKSGNMVNHCGRCQFLSQDWTLGWLLCYCDQFIAYAQLDNTLRIYDGILGCDGSVGKASDPPKSAPNGI